MGCSRQGYNKWQLQWITIGGLFPSFPGPLYQNKVKCLAFQLEIILHSHANKTHFHKKGCACGLILKVRPMLGNP